MSRSKWEIAYSIGILIAIPLLITLNTILLASSTRNAFNLELRRKSDLVNATIAESSVADIVSGEYEALDDKLKQIEASQPSIRQSQAIVKQDDEYIVVARGNDVPTELTPSRLMQVQIAEKRKLPIAQLVNISDNGHASQAWNVATPLINNDKVIAVFTSSILTTDAEEAIDTAYQTSFIVLIVSVIIILALLFRHFRLVGYVQSLAKQKELNQTMSDFLSVATHELKAPTTIIKGYLSNVLDGSFGEINNTISDQLKTAMAQTDRMNALVQDLLNVSRIDQGRIEYSLKEVDSAALLQVLYTNFEPIAKQKGLELKLSTTDMANVRVDEGRLQEIFTNLIDNAIKYTATGNVTISQSIKDRRVITSIKDTGFGISPEARKRLFQRFYRIKTDNTKNIGGTGLGLWIIKQYIEAMGGKIEVESLEGAGSNFIVTFPQISS